MRKLVVALFATIVALTASAQEIPTVAQKTPLNRAADHFMVQLMYNGWQGAPDSVQSHIGGFQRSANVYLMLDKPFSGNNQFSVAAGLGVGTTNIYFKKMIVDIGSTNSTLPFRAVDNADNYKKFKLTTAFLEIPLEFRYMSDPTSPNKTVKAAIGIKAGTMLNAHTKGKVLRNATGATLNSRTDKVLSKSYFNTTRLAATARVGYGIFSLVGAYSFSPVFKDGVAPDIKGWQIGLSISGL